MPIALNFNFSLNMQAHTKAEGGAGTDPAYDTRRQGWRRGWSEVGVGAGACETKYTIEYNNKGRNESGNPGRGRKDRPEEARIRSVTTRAAPANVPHEFRVPDWIRKEGSARAHPASKSCEGSRELAIRELWTRTPLCRPPYAERGSRARQRR